MKHYSEILEQCAKIAKERDEYYGCPLEQINRQIDIMKSFGLNASPEGICKTMIAMKLSRDEFKRKADNIIDAINYLAIMLWLRNK